MQWHLSSFLDRERIRSTIDAVLRDLHYSPKKVFGINLCIDEAVDNAFRHGNKFDPTKRVHFTFVADSSHVFITITDEGAGFTSSQIPDALSPEGLSASSGRGIFLMNHYMDVTHTDGGRSIHLCSKKEVVLLERTEET